MMMRVYVLALCAAYFLLWASVSGWSLDAMIFWEGHNASYPIWPWAPIARLAGGFIVFMTALIALASAEGTKR